MSDSLYVDVDMDAECGPDPTFYLYSMILALSAFFSLLMSIISCSVIRDIRKKKSEGVCDLDEIEEEEEEEEEFFANAPYYYMARMKQNDPEKLESQYKDVIQKYLTHQKKMQP